MVEYEKLLQEKLEIDAEHPIVPERAFDEAIKKIEEKERRKTRLSKLKSESASEPVRSPSADQ